MLDSSMAGTFDDYVALSLESGVPPIDFIYRPIVDCDAGEVIALRAETVINSVVLGRLGEADYTGVCDERESGIALFAQSVRHALRAIERFRECSTPISFLSVRCPAEIAETPGADLFGMVRDALREHRTVPPSALCIEFPPSLMEKHTDKARTALLDLKALKVKTMIAGCGKEDFPISKLVTVPPDAVMLDESATAWAGSRDKPALFSALVSYLKSMGIEAYAAGTAEKRRALRNSDCVGFLDSERAPLTQAEVLDLMQAETAL